MIQIAKTLGNGYQLDLMLTSPNKNYFSKITSLVEGSQNVRLIPPVKFNEIIPFISKYGIGLYLLPPNNFNNIVALPNKFFEFIQARLCIVIGPSPEMMRYVNKFRLGIVSDNFNVEKMITSLKSLTREEITKYKMNANIAAQELSAENFNQLFIDSINKL